jgi:hypothetical protein
VSGSGGSGATGGSAVVPCPAGQETTISGVVYDPAGARPLYGVSVYVPGGALAPLPQGAASCDRCGAALSGQPLAAAETDATGRFVLRNVPAGSGVPLVMQTGKWRRQVAIPSVVACADNAVSDRNLTRLPRNRTEGDLPRIAVSTGGSDAFECLLRRIGVSDSEFTTDVGAGRVHLYVGGPAGSTEGPGTTSFAPELGGARLPHATTLWSNPAKLLGYDMLLLSCEGSSYASEKSPYLANIAAYADAGGRVLAGHNQFVWITNGSAAYQQTADYIGVGEDLPQPATVLVDTTFPKGAAFADWLLVVGASAIRGELVIYQGQYSVAAVTPPTRRWLHLPAHPVETTPVTTYLTFDTPPGAPPANQCGRFALVDMHLNTRTPEGGGGDRSEPDVPFPTGCAATPMTPQLTAMEFLLFDLGSCL